MKNLSLFPELEDVNCSKARRRSVDRNGEYVYACQLPAYHDGPCQHRWQTDTTPGTAA